LKSVALPVRDIIVIGVLDGGRVRRFLERGENILSFPLGSTPLQPGTCTYWAVWAKKRTRTIRLRSREVTSKGVERGVSVFDYPLPSCLRGLRERRKLRSRIPSKNTVVDLVMHF